MKKFQIALNWNGEIVLQGVCSTTIAYTLIQHLFVDNFAGEQAKFGKCVAPTLEQVLEAHSQNAELRDTISDSTGVASYHLVPMR